MVESLTESIVLDSETGPQRVTAVLRARFWWGRSKIPTHHPEAAVAGHRGAAVGVFSSKVKIALVDYLFAPDQLPHSYSASRELLQLLAESIRERKHLTMPPESLEEAPDVVLRYAHDRRCPSR